MGIDILSVFNPPEDKKVVTRADRIRSITDEELAEEFVQSFFYVNGYRTNHVYLSKHCGEFDTKKDAEEFKGIHNFGGNGGWDKLIGVYGHNESIKIDGEIEFISCEEL